MSTRIDVIPSNEMPKALEMNTDPKSNVDKTISKAVKKALSQFKNHDEKRRMFDKKVSLFYGTIGLASCLMQGLFCYAFGIPKAMGMELLAFGAGMCTVEVPRFFARQYCSKWT